MNDLDNLHEFVTEHQEQQREFSHDMWGTAIVALLVGWAWNFLGNRRVHPTHPLQTNGSPQSTRVSWGLLMVFAIIVGVTVALVL